MSVTRLLEILNPALWDLSYTWGSLLSGGPEREFGGSEEPRSGLRVNFRKLVNTHSPCFPIAPACVSSAENRFPEVEWWRVLIPTDIPSYLINWLPSLQKIRWGQNILGCVQCTSCIKKPVRVGLRLLGINIWERQISDAQQRDRMGTGTAVRGWGHKCHSPHMCKVGGLVMQLLIDWSPW